MIPSVLVITADDYGYAASYDRGILEAARAGAIDAAGVMILREPEPRRLLSCGVETGLHLERLDEAPVAAQVDRFTRFFGRPPDYLDGHHHCHAAPGLAAEVAEVGRALGIPVRPVSADHRRLLIECGVACVDRIVGRMSEAEAALPVALEAWLDRGEAQAGITEWIVHPGHPDPAAGSSYDRGRAEDLALVLSLGDGAAWAARGIRRAGPRAALAGQPHA